MSSDPTTRLNTALEGRYRIESELGEGGMATVYLADDLKHERKVALKVLKPELAAVVGAERFLAEIKTTANLQHPHILPLFDSGEADSFLFYVMPYVEGETLRDRLERERQLPVEEAVRIASDVAEALQAAHEQGVIHRDIKPANILLSRGDPLVADFGIALAVNAAGGGRLTETGLSLGTPHYMSPEQATGDLSVGAAADVYALGCVLYEMLVGEPPYTGSTAQAILGKIISGQVASATEHRTSVPANVDAVIRRALEKLPADRFRGCHDFAQALVDPAFRHGESVAAGVGAVRGYWKPLAIALGGGLAIVLAGGLGWALTRPAPATPSSRVVRFSLPTNTWTGTNRPWWTTMAVSPSGDILAYQDAGSGMRIRRLDQDRSELIEANAGGPLFSPDGEWLWFASWETPDGEQDVKRLSLADGSIETIADAPPGVLWSASTWADDGTLVASTGNALYRIPEGGGDWTVLVERKPNSGERVEMPHMLPGSETLLFHVGRRDPAQAEVVAMDMATQTRKTLVTDAMDPRYVETGHLLFMRQGTLMGVAFDLDEVEVRGEPVILVEDVMHSVYRNNIPRETGAAQAAISPAGHLAYQRGGISAERPGYVVRVSPTGAADTLDMDPREYGKLRVSPDGNRLAYEARHGLKSEIWVRDLTRGVAHRLNTRGFGSTLGAWSPEGRRLAITSDDDLYVIAADGSGEPEPVAPSERWQRIMDWSTEGVMLYLEAGDLWTVATGEEPARFFESDASERWAIFSPDGRWVAYTSDQSGRDEVYVRPYPGPEPAFLVSGDGGQAPTWSPDGRTLFFRGPGDTAYSMMAVDVEPGDTFRAGRARPWIEPWLYVGFSPVRAYDVTRDGSFLAYVNVEDTTGPVEPAEMHVVLNWFNELRERIPN